MKYILCFILITVSSVESQAQKIDKQMLRSVFKIAIPTREGDKIGTGFLARYKDAVYFITAKHLFPGYSNGDSCTVGLLANDTLHPQRMKVFFDSAPLSSDVAVLTGLFNDVDIHLPNLDSTKNVDVGETIVFLGYPSTNIVANSIPINTISDGKPSPLLKKGILAGLNNSNKTNIIAIFDAQSAPGFSGSPVFVYNEYSRSYYLIAVMAGGYLSNSQVSDGKATVELKDMFYLTSLSFGSSILYAKLIISDIILKNR